MKNGGSFRLTFQSLAVSLRTARFNIQKTLHGATLRCVFCADLWPESGFCFMQH